MSLASWGPSWQPAVPKVRSKRANYCTQLSHLVHGARRICPAVAALPQLGRAGRAWKLERDGLQGWNPPPSPQAILSHAGPLAPELWVPGLARKFPAFDMLLLLRTNFSSMCYFASMDLI